MAKKARCQFTQFLHNQESCELHVGLAIGLITCSRQPMSEQCTFNSSLDLLHVCDMHHFFFFFFSAVFCSTTVRPSPTPSRQTGGLSPSVKMSPSSTVSIYYTPPHTPSSTVSIYYTQYTPLSTQVGSLVSTTTVSGKKSNVLNNRLFSNYNQKFSQIVFQIYLWISFVTSSFLLEFPQN